MMSVVRAFIAVDLPLELRERLVQISDDLNEQMGTASVRWVPAEKIHLTLKFLGDVSLNNLDVLKDILRGEAVDREPMVISLGGVGAFPKTRHPRVIWVGVESPPELKSLQRGIDKQTARVGYALNRRPFSPHITLGRVSRNASPAEVRAIGNVLSDTKVGFVGVAKIQAVHIYRSDLRPDGAVYSRLCTAEFEG
ncbi:MAG: RNA 2',3'-cyclic phosphodiesterase [Chloroflexota bacterium]|nr:RNA 2',3'-cyclic phosphodiesterase [Chloroflexota bacterium]